MPTSITLVYAPDCPNVELARERIQGACVTLGRAHRWDEVDVTAPDTPKHLRNLGSPTILVDGADVEAHPASQGACCRVYSGDGHQAPSIEAIVQALRAAGP